MRDKGLELPAKKLFFARKSKNDSDTYRVLADPG